jgi:hypothetical protein
MKVVFSFGAQSQAIIDGSLKGLVDNVEVVTFANVQDLVDTARNRGICYNRITFSSKFLNDYADDLQVLADYIHNDPSARERTELIYLTNDKNVAIKNIFDDLFNNPLLHLSATINGAYSTDILKSLLSKEFSDLKLLLIGEDIVDSIEEVEDVIEEVAVETDLKKVEQTNGLKSNLNLANAGEEHLDTGFLSEDMFENEITVEDADVVEFTEVEEEVKSELEVLEFVQEIKDPEKQSIRLIAGVRGSGVTSKVVDESFKTSRGNKKEGSATKKVLVVDLDDKCNGILSFFETETSDFYRQGCMNGISDLRRNSFFTVDGVDVISNGFGLALTPEDVENLLKSEFVKSYDVIYLDCPLDCIDLLTPEVLRNVVCMLKIAGHLGSLHNTLHQLTSREYVTAEVEDLLFKKSRFLVSDKAPEYGRDLTYIKEHCLFGRNDWYTKLSQ